MRPTRTWTPCQVRSWITLDVAKKLLADSGQDFDALKKAALTKEFRPVSIGAKASFDLKQTVRSFKSHNVVGKIEGSDPKLKDEWVIYTAHWDHLGRHEELKGDQIFNGALDNASGVAAILEIAAGAHEIAAADETLRAFHGHDRRGSRAARGEILCEQSALSARENTGRHQHRWRERLGKNARHRRHQLRQLRRWTTCWREAATRHGRVLKPNSQPEKGSFYRADHFEFSKLGVPSLYPGSGKDVIGKPPGFGMEKSNEYIAKHYHQPSDEVDPAWDLSGAADDAVLLVRSRLPGRERRQISRVEPGDGVQGEAG